MPSNASGELKEYLRSTVLHQLPCSLQSSFETALNTAKLRSMQNKQLAANPLHPPGALLLGDSFNMRHPLTGGGMTIALSDTKLLCDMLQPIPNLYDPLHTAKCTAEFYLKRKPLSSTINTLANALYEVFREGEGDAHKEMRQAVFDYLALGENSFLSHLAFFVLHFAANSRHESALASISMFDKPTTWGMAQNCMQRLHDSLSLNRWPVCVKQPRQVR
jgi:2-polyprenyl-6-methoxyphenol hydroxylase-like FAD-dependent oxidoreductase